jgi:hypothetical protein
MKELLEPKAVESWENKMISWIDKRIDLLRNDKAILGHYSDWAKKFIRPTELGDIPSEKRARVILEIFQKELEPGADLSELDSEKVLEFINVINDIIVQSSEGDKQNEPQLYKEEELGTEISAPQAQ